jgi:hypothetical protein
MPSLQESSNMNAPKPDRIIDVVHQFIQDERVRSFCFLAKHSHRFMDQSELLVVSHAAQDNVQMIKRHNRYSYLPALLDLDWYTLEEPKRHDSLSHTVAITSSNAADISIENLTITIPRQSAQPRTLPLIVWLRETYDWDDDWVMKFSKRQYEEQRLWWDSTGQSFRLFDLPLELREAVYLQIIGPILLPDRYKRQLVLGQGLSYGTPTRLGRNCDPDIEPPNMTVMRVSKLIRDEALLVAHRDTFKRFRKVGAARAFDAVRQPAHEISAILNTVSSQFPNATFLRNIQLEMSAESYLACIGVQPTLAQPLADGYSTFRLDSLRAFPALQRLDFRFIGPKHPGAVCPWAAVINTAKDGDHSCQTMWVHWFFTLAWDVLQTLHTSGRIHITLSGCVKTAVQKFWEHMLNDRKADHTSFIRSKEAEIRATKTYPGPIPCKCSTQCSKKAAEDGKTHFFSEAEIRRIEGLQKHIDDMYWVYEK